MLLTTSLIGSALAVDRYVTHGNDYGPGQTPLNGSLRLALTSLPTNNDVPCRILFRSHVTGVDLSLGGKIETEALGPLTFETEGQSCYISGAEIEVDVPRGSQVTMSKLSFDETLQFIGPRVVTASNCSFTGEHTFVGGLGHFIVSTSNWAPAEIGQVSKIVLNNCVASGSWEDGIQAKHWTPEDIDVDVIFCQFHNNVDDGFEVENFGENLSPEGGGIKGSILLSDANNNNNGFNINEGDDGNVDMTIAGCSASNSSDSGIEVKERAAGANYAIINGFTAGWSSGEGVLVKEADAGAITTTLSFIDSYFSGSQGVQVDEREGGSGLPAVTTTVLFTDVDAYSNTSHGFEIQTSGKHKVDVNPGGGGVGSYFNYNGKTGFKVDNPGPQDSNVELNNAEARFNIERGFYINQKNARIGCWLEGCYIDDNFSTDVWLRSRDWNGPRNTCSMETSSSNGIYGSIVLVPDPAPTWPNAAPPINSYTNWILSLFAHDNHQ